MLGRRQGEVAPTRKVALKIEMRPTGRPRKTDALASWPGRRAAFAPPDFGPSWSIECRGFALWPGPARLTFWRAGQRAGGLADERNFLAESSVP